MKNVGPQITHYHRQQTVTGSLSGRLLDQWGDEEAETAEGVVAEVDLTDGPECLVYNEIQKLVVLKHVQSEGSLTQQRFITFHNNEYRRGT